MKKMMTENPIKKKRNIVFYLLILVCIWEALLFFSFLIRRINEGSQICSIYQRTQVLKISECPWTKFSAGWYILKEYQTTAGHDDSKNESLENINEIVSDWEIYKCLHMFRIFHRVNLDNVFHNEIHRLICSSNNI